MYTKGKVGSKHTQSLQLSLHIPNRQQYMHHTSIFPVVLNMCACQMPLNIENICNKKHLSISDTQMQCSTLNMWKNRTTQHKWLWYFKFPWDIYLSGFSGHFGGWFGVEREVKI
jgi:hypothetical protein